MTDFTRYAATTLPHEPGAVFRMDGGIETTLIFHDGLDLSHFAAFPLLETETGRARGVFAAISTSPSPTAQASFSRPRPGARTPIGRRCSDPMLARSTGSTMRLWASSALSPPIRPMPLCRRC